MSLSKLEKNLRDFFKENPEKAYKPDEVASIFNYGGNKNFKRLIKALNFLEHIGELEITQQGRYRAKVQMDKTAIGIFRANPKGFGFVNIEEGEPDLFIPPNQVGEAMDGDEVEVTIIKEVNPQTGKGSEARIERVVKRATQQLVGEFFAYNKDEREKTGYLGFVEPNTVSSRHLQIFVLPEGVKPVDGSIVIVKIKDYPSAERPNVMTGLVAKEIGHKDAPGVDILSVLYKFNIPHEFPDNVLEEVEQFPDEVDPQDMVGRVDLRDELIFTIDGADAKDLDDAISIERLENGNFKLGVHIADVSHYVRENSAIDLEASERGTSVYLTDRVVPMLPQKLSNGLCSLHANEDRLTKSCIMTIDGKGKVLDYQILSSVINSSYRMTYDDVNAIIDGDVSLREKYSELVGPIETMVDLHKVLENMRRRRGAIDFDSQEAQIIVDEEGNPTDIELRERGVGERLIESFMLAANETIARHFTQKELPFIYRVHDTPDEDRITSFAEFATSFGLILRGNPASIAPKDLQILLSAAKDEPFEPVLSMMMLRSMQQAIYSEEAKGHFGLAARDYTHFTSPIRRYPDLIVHRLITEYAGGRPNQSKLAKIQERIPGIAEHSSKMERRAVDAEREVDAMKKAEYMAQHIGEEFEGTVSSITSFGMFIQLPNTIEGLIRLDQLRDDYYQFNQQHMMLIGERSGRVFRIGQRVVIEVAGVDVAERQIDFILIDAEDVKADPNIIRQTQKERSSKRRRENGKRREPQDHKQKRSKNTKSKKRNSRNKNFKISKRSN